MDVTSTAGIPANQPSPPLKPRRVGTAQKLWNICAVLHQNKVFENSVRSKVGFTNRRRDKKNSCISYPHSSTSLTKPYPKHPLWRWYGHLMRYLSLMVTLTAMRAAFSAKIKWLTEEYAKNIFLRPAFPSHLYSSLSLHKILIKIFVFDKYCWLHALVRAVLLKNKNRTKQCSFNANWGEMWIRHWKIMLLLTVFSWWRLSILFFLFFLLCIAQRMNIFLRRV